MALGWIEARVTENVLMRDAETAADKFQVATEDMDNWQRIYYETVFQFKSQMIPELVCPDPQVPIQSLAKVEQQIEKVSASSFVHSFLGYQSNVFISPFFRCESAAEKRLSNWAS